MSLSFSQQRSMLHSRVQSQPGFQYQSDFTLRMNQIPLNHTDKRRQSVFVTRPSVRLLGDMVSPGAETESVSESKILYLLQEPFFFFASLYSFPELLLK